MFIEALKFENTRQLLKSFEIAILC